MPAGGSGNATIDTGTLLVEDTLGAAATTVANGGTLGGSGSIIGAVTVASGGTVSPGDNAIGTLDVDGDVTFDAGSTYEVEVEPGGTDSDLILATGTATLNGGSVVHIGVDGTYDPSATIPSSPPTAGSAAPSTMSAPRARSARLRCAEAGSWSMAC